MDHLLSWLVFIPLIAVAVMLAIPQSKAHLYKWVALVALSVVTVLSVVLVCSFDSKVTGYGAQSMQFVQQLDWIQLNLGSFGSLLIQYHIGVDGLSLALVLLSAIVLFIGVISSWNITKNLQGYFMLYMVLSTSVIGCFVALDFFLFYLFFEFMLLPMYFLIGIWGGKRRAYASIKFFIYTLVGSLLILMVMIGLSLSVVQNPESSVHVFDIMKMMNPDNFLSGSLLAIDFDGRLMGLTYRAWAFILLIIGFAIKLPAVPVHTWLPDAHVEAPTPISVVLAGILLKIGGYGFYRIGYTIFPDGAIEYGWWIGLIGVVAIVYAAFVAMAQSDLKRLIAYSSVSHMGFVMLGMASLTVEGNAGALFQMFSHGIISALLFLMAGVLYDRTGDRMIANYSGLASKMPWYSVAVIISFFAALGLPGFSGFIAEFLVLIGAFDGAVNGSIVATFMPILGLLGLVLGAAYFLWTIQRMFFGKFWVRDESWQLPDLTTREWIMIVPLVIMALVFGIFPGLLLDLANETVMGFVDYVHIQGSQNLELINAIVR
ncbi:NADH-quinone oxidoreductase subunit M [Reichenbachiella carrageenanivorans]|uniref:NADH-quinone oxidoreductase subunit M n=1 Tax=Reichenbachiella carrageenanivorans TaxID=2979869 RepID=A0ABY6D1R5_9BACT|nr:NADH-quinone oxidoreductase subunit M [Reichenbachiella carrageenanivorans]UXX79545.1 NADH-quinone oxidoreductase subunit M [Reichenbachiella carrageenanivorans]